MSEPEKCPRCGSDDIIDPILWEPNDVPWWECPECNHRWIGPKPQEERTDDVP